MLCAFPECYFTVVTIGFSELSCSNSVCVASALRPFAQHVDPETESTHSTHSNPDSRGALLDQIRGGVQLKSVPDSARISPSENKLEGLAGALARALQERAKACMPDDSDSSDDSESEEDEWDD